MQTLQLGALDMFFHTIMGQKAAEIADQSLARKKELNNFLERNFQNGSGSKAQVLKTRADVADQIAQTIIAKRDAKVARMNLNAMMGRNLTDSTALDTVASPERMAAASIPKPDDAVATALSQRSDIQSMKFLAESTKGGAKIYKAMYLPTIAATGSAGYTRMNSDLSLVNNNGSPNWTLGVGAQWTLFDGFANSAKAAQYMSDANKLEIAASTMGKMIEIEVRSAILECSAADSNLNSSREMFSAASETYELTNSNFKQGSGQFADLQLADETLQQAELGMINARYRQTTEPGRTAGRHGQRYYKDQVDLSIIELWRNYDHTNNEGSRSHLAAGALCIIACAATMGCDGKDTTKHGAAARHPADSATVKVVVADVNEGPFEDWGSYSADLRGIEDANLMSPAQGGRVNSLKPVGTFFKDGRRPVRHRRGQVRCRAGSRQSASRGRERRP